LEKIKGSLFSIFAALLVGAGIIAISGQSPLAAYWSMVQGSFGSLQKFMQVLAFTTPLIFTGLAAALAFQAGVFNIGIEGQLKVGAFVGTLVGIYFKAPWPLPLVASLISAALAGAIWALIPGLLVGRTPASLLVATIRMNSIGALLVDYFLRFYFIGENATTLETDKVGAGAILPRFTPSSQLTYGILIAVVLIGVIYFLLFHTTTGFSLRSIGKNADAARQAGVPVFKNTLLALVISGAIAGLGGVVVVLGVYSRYITDFSPGYGWDGITVAILAGNNPILLFLSAGFFGMLRAAAISMNFGKTLSVDLISVLQGIIICFVAAPLLWKTVTSMFKKERNG
jgi:simple sugar transport system permease protein